MAAGCLRHCAAALFGAPGEAVGYDRLLKSNTSKRRSHSLFRQGCMIYQLSANMPEKWLRPITEMFAALLAEGPVFSRTCGVIYMRGCLRCWIVFGGC
jgi:hypothetical protein